MTDIPTTMTNTPTTMTKIYADRYPDAGRTNAWHGEMVHIGSNMGLWRPHARGYTDKSAEAWLVPFADALRHVRGVGAEKTIYFALPDGHPGIHTKDHVPVRKTTPTEVQPDDDDGPGF